MKQNSELSIAGTWQDPFLKEVLDADPEEAIQIADDLSPHDLYDRLSSCLGASRKCDVAKAKLNRMIGHLLVRVQSCPQVWEGQGYSSYEDFLVRGVAEKLCIPRSECYRIKKVAELWPSLTAADFLNLGTGKLKTLVHIGRESDPSSSALLDKANSMRTQEFREYAEKEHHVPKLADVPGWIAFACSKELEVRWKEFVASPLIQETAGSDSAAGILEAMMSEVAVEWFGGVEVEVEEP